MKNNETDILQCNCTSEFFSQKLIISLKLIKKKKKPINEFLQAVSSVCWIVFWPAGWTFLVHSIANDLCV